MFRFFESLIDPFRQHDESMPPANLLGFYWRYCRQVWPFLLCLMAVGLAVSLIEVSMLRYIGSLVDLLRATSPGRTGRAFCGWASSSWWRGRSRALRMTSSPSRRWRPA
jgi:hypothetical protein